MVEACRFQATLDLLGRKHNLTILWALSRQRPRRFNELREALEIPPASLSQRLGELEEAGILASARFAESPPRVEYDLTPAGEELLSLVGLLDKWSSRHPNEVRKAARLD